MKDKTLPFSVCLMFILCSETKNSLSGICRYTTIYRTYYVGSNLDWNFPLIL